MLRIYNTLTRRKEEFTPLVDGIVRMYVCGVTVYDRSHIGHARSAIVFDVIRRYLAFNEYRVRFVKNFTDVDDRIIRRANQEGVAARDISERYIEEYRADMAALGVEPAEVEPRATEHIPEMVDLIERLIERGVAYTVDGDVYFEVRRFPGYGRLSRRNLEELVAGARVEVDERKRDPLDFALWKSSKPDEPWWDSPWGRGRPGWHIECSAMSMKYLSEGYPIRTFDIHGGGEDLIFPHHENEIAQSEAGTGAPFARCWVHNAFVNVGAEKMSKSLGNTLTIRDLLARHDPQALRLHLLGTHYRNPMEFTEDRVRESARALERFVRLIQDAEPLWAAPSPVIDDAPLPEGLARLRGRFVGAMDDDFNTPQALGVLFDLGRVLHGYREVASGETTGPLARGVRELLALGRVLGLFDRIGWRSGPPPGVLAMVEQRAAARRSKDWKRSDQLRAEIARLGWSVEDTARGTRLSPRGAPAGGAS